MIKVVYELHPIVPKTKGIKKSQGQTTSEVI